MVYSTITLSGTLVKFYRMFMYPLLTIPLRNANILARIAEHSIIYQKNYFYLPFLEPDARATDITPRTHRTTTASMECCRRSACEGAGRSTFQLDIGRKVNFSGTSRGWTFSGLSTSRQFHLKRGVFWRLVGLLVAAVAGCRERFIAVARADGAAGGRAASALAARARPRPAFDTAQ